MGEQAAIENLIRWLESRIPRIQRPLVTLTYAQSLDGSLAGPSGERLALSGPSSLRMTHALRAWHDSILVGIGTVLADDPGLTVRWAEGPSPRPVILDTHLSIPIQARVLGQGTKPILFCDPQAPKAKADDLGQRGVAVVRVERRAEKQAAWLSLPTVLHTLHEMGLRRLMVEGGAKVLGSFLRQRLGDVLILTLAPRMVGGLPLQAPGSTAEPATWPHMLDPQWYIFGDDAVVCAGLETARS